MTEDTPLKFQKLVDDIADKLSPYRELIALEPINERDLDREDILYLQSFDKLLIICCNEGGADND